MSTALHRVAAAALLASVLGCAPNGEPGPEVAREQAARVAAGEEVHDGQGDQASAPDPHAGHTMTADEHADHEGTAGPVAEHAEQSAAAGAAAQHRDHVAAASGRSGEHAAHRPGPAAHPMRMAGTDTATAARDDAGHARLMELVRSLLADSVVQRRVQADAELRRLWADTAVKNHVMGNDHQH